METRAEQPRTSSLPEARAGDPPAHLGHPTRWRLLDAARTVFERDGFTHARVTDIAHLGGLVHGGFYRYFESKDAIFLEIASGAVERLGTPFDGVVFEPDRHGELPASLSAGVQRYLEVYLVEARILRLLDEVGGNGGDAAGGDRGQVSGGDGSQVWGGNPSQARALTRRRGVAAQEQAVRRSQDAGLLEPAVAAPALLYALVAMVEGFAERWLVHGSVTCDLPTAVAQLSRLCLQAIQPAARLETAATTA